MKAHVFAVLPILSSALQADPPDAKPLTLAEALTSFHWSWESYINGPKDVEAIDFYRNGFALADPWFSARWIVTDPRTACLEWGDGQRAYLVFDASFTRYVAIDFNGQTNVEGTRGEPADPRRPYPKGWEQSQDGGRAGNAPVAHAKEAVSESPDSAKGPVSGSAVWDMAWDDKVDDSLDVNSKSCRLRLKFAGTVVDGQFDGPVPKQPRDARFIGKLIRSEGTSLLILQQDERDYTCVYEMQALEGGTFFGVWHDTQGRKGDVELRPAAAPEAK
jgi:hypothetical protein